MDFIKDTEFLHELEDMNIKVQYCKIILLDFDEKPIREIQGIVKNGTLNINGASAIRRTISLTIVANKETNNIENIDNLISINKKIKVYIGYKNLLQKYQHYGDIVWFKCGVFIVSSASSTTTIQDCTINLTAQDKMVFLNGFAGGTLPAQVNFKEFVQPDGTILTPTIYETIYKSVSQYGLENPGKILIYDLDDQQLQLTKFISTNQNFFVGDAEEAGIVNYKVSSLNSKSNFTKYQNGDNIGYILSKYYYADKLILEAGNTVQTLLNKIVTGALNNYEYYYDVDGNFIFQQKKNYLNTQYTPLHDLHSIDYLKNFSDTKYTYIIKNNQQNITIQNSPKYDNIKNDFIALGTKSLGNGIAMTLKYHVVIEKRPQPQFVRSYMYYNLKTNKYEFYEGRQSFSPNLELIGEKAPEDDYEWREEIYRQALVKYSNNEVLTSYESELITKNNSGKDLWRTLYSDKNKWIYDESTLTYWLDFIDTDNIIKYSVSNIGFRTKVEKIDNISTIYPITIPDIVYVDDYIDVNSEEYLKVFSYKQCKIREYDKNKYLSISNQKASLFDIVRKMIYQHLFYNSTVTITTLPKFYLEPNNLIYIQDEQTGIAGDYAIQSMSIPLGISGNMTITAIQCNRKS